MGNSSHQNSLKHQAPHTCIPSSFSPSDGILNIESRDWREAVSSNLVANIDEWRVTKQLKCNQISESILHKISHIRFPFIMHLNLVNNNIASIQCISSMWMPGIQTIKLDDNKIRDVRNLRKLTKGKALTQISLNENVINECPELYESSRKFILSINTDVNLEWGLKYRSAVRVRFHAKDSRYQLRQNAFMQKVNRLFPN